MAKIIYTRNTSKKITLDIFETNNPINIETQILINYSKNNNILLTDLIKTLNVKVNYEPLRENNIFLGIFNQDTQKVSIINYDKKGDVSSALKAVEELKYQDLELYNKIYQVVISKYSGAIKISNLLNILKEQHCLLSNTIKI